MITEYRVSGMTCQGCVAKVKFLLEHNTGVKSAMVTLPDSATLEMDHEIGIHALQKALGEKYTLTPLTDNTFQTVEKQNLVLTYKPLFIVFSYITFFSVITSFSGSTFSFMMAMNTFMAGFFIVFSFFKMLNLKDFANSYAMYDVIAKSFPLYGYIYPFLELLLGLAYLLHVELFYTNIATVIIMSVSSIGVITSVMNKEKIRCACLGSVFNLPMSTITILEDLLMVAMAIFMLLFAL